MNVDVLPGLNGQALLLGKVVLFFTYFCSTIGQKTFNFGSRSRIISTGKFQGSTLKLPEGTIFTKKMKDARCTDIYSEQMLCFQNHLKFS